MFSSEFRVSFQPTTCSPPLSPFLPRVASQGGKAEKVALTQRESGPARVRNGSPASGRLRGEVVALLAEVFLLGVSPVGGVAA